MIVYVLTKRYYDNSSSVHVCGVTENRAVAQAFQAGGNQDSSMVVEVFKCNLAASLHDGVGAWITPEKPEDL